MKKLLFLLSALAGTMIPATAAESDNAVFTMTESGFRIEAKKTEKLSFSGEFLMRAPDDSTGKTGKEARSNGDYEWKITPSASGKVILLDCVIENKSDRELRLEPGLTAQVSPREKDYYWNGFDVVRAGGRKISRAGFKGRTSKHIGGGLCQPFPVSALIGRNYTFFLGTRQHILCSWHGSEYCPGDNGARLIFSQRLVVPAKSPVKFQFTLGITPRRFDREENIVQAYYDAFPADFLPKVSRNHFYIWRAHSQYRSWGSVSMDAERERRFYAAFDWAYAPFKRSGDHYGREELWNYRYLLPDKGYFYQGCDKITAAEFRGRRQKSFLKNGEKYGFAFYVGAAWCELQLAREKYPDAINNDTEGGVKTILGPWCTQHDMEIRVFPMGTSFGKVCREDVARLYKDLNLRGFALDCGSPGVNYRGPAVNDASLPGRAWDKKGLFIDELTGVMTLMDYIHALNPADPPFVWKNGAGPGDVMMIETSIFNPIFESWMPLTRYNIGMRPAVVHSPGFLFNQTIPNWRELTKEEFYRQLGKLADYATLTDFQYGFTQSHVTQSGNPQSLYTMPELLECIRTGWQALVPVAIKPKSHFLQTARYGKGADTILFMGNPGRSKEYSFKVDNSELGGGINLFALKMRDHSSLMNQADNGETCFRDVLPSRRPRLYEAVCNLNPAPANGRLTAKVAAEKRLNRIVFTAETSGHAPFTTRITPRRIDWFKAEIQLNGKKVAPGETVKISSGDKLELIYRSTLFHCDEPEISSFPFLNGQGRPEFDILLPEHPAKEELQEAERLKDYFRFTAEKKITGAVKAIRIKRIGASAPGVRLAVSDAYPEGISRDGDTLTVCVRDKSQLRTVARELYHVMDRRFEYIFPFMKFSRLDCLTPELMKRFDMDRTHLPFDRCFEGKTK